MEELHHAAISHPLKALPPEFVAGEQTGNVHQHQAVLYPYDQRCGHHVGKVRCFPQALWPGPPEGLRHGRGDVVWMVSLSCQDVEGVDTVGAGRMVEKGDAATGEKGRCRIPTA